MKPIIICIVGESGSGKSLAADYINKKFGIDIVKSRTTRPKRTPNESGHLFVTEEEFDSYKKEDMLAFTDFGDKRYCCLKGDMTHIQTYVIDEFGLEYLFSNFYDKYHIISMRIKRPDIDRVEDIGVDRFNRDKGKFNFPDKYYDIVINNNMDISSFEVKISSFLEKYLVGKGLD